MLITLLILLLLSNALTLQKDKSMLFSRVVIVSLMSSSFLVWNNLLIKPLEKGIGVYGGLFHVTTFTHTFNMFLFIISAIILTLTAYFPRKVDMKQHSSIYNLFFSKVIYNKSVIANTTGEQFTIIEYALIVVFVICGAVFLISTSDLISLFLSIELQSYGLYILSTLYRDSEVATGSGLTYFLLGGLSSCFILLGSALLYANSGTTSLDDLYVITSLSDVNSLPDLIVWYQPLYIRLSLIIMSVGLLFKISASPFHFWSPDVYDGIPTIVTTYVAIVAKLSIFAFFLELIYYTECNFFAVPWKDVILLSSLLSLIIGSILGLTQFRIKRLLAYSTISHVGFILLALSVNSPESIQSYIFYIFQYTLSNLNVFVILISIGYTLYLYVYKGNNSKHQLIDQNNSPIQLVNQIKGYFDINPFISISFAITIFSFVGIPPVIGFFAKQMVLSAALDNGFVFMALIAIITSVIGAGYYLNLIKQIFFYKSDYEKNPSINDKESIENETETVLNTERISDKPENLNEKVLQSSLIQSITLTGYKLPIGAKAKSFAFAKEQGEKIYFKPEDITINSSLSGIISVITLLLILFMYMPNQWFNLVNVLTLILFKA